MKGEQKRIVIDSLANSGDGVGRIDQKVFFVPFSCPGDELVVEITEEKKSFAKAKIVQILKAAPTRVAPPCAVFGRCGGCDWQHIDYSVQLEWKKANLLRTLENIGGLEDLAVVQNVLASPSIYNYRNRIQVHHDAHGFFYNEKSSHRAVYIEQCPIASIPINEMMGKPRPFSLKDPGKSELAETETGVSAFPVHSRGASELGFRQVNDRQNQALIDKTIALIRENDIKMVYDLYCGQGNWTLAIQDQQPEVQCIGVESDPVNLEKAKTKANGSTQFVLGRSEKVYPIGNSTADLVIIDPPRSGCDVELIERLQKHKPRFLIYVSCHPATLARDLKILCTQGFSLGEVLPVDMFPQTAHLEVWCMLRSDTEMGVLNNQKN